MLDYCIIKIENQHILIKKTDDEVNKLEIDHINFELYLFDSTSYDSNFNVLL